MTWRTSGSRSTGCGSADAAGQPAGVYGFGRVDASGRVADRAIIAALGWSGGDRLTLTVDARPSRAD